MARLRHKAIVAGLTLTLTFGCLGVPAIASTASASAAYNASLENLPAPGEFDRGGEYEAGAMAESAIELAAVDATAVSGISDEMKYFTRFESNCNYDQGFSYGDGYNAMGYYQFDRRYSLVPFIESVYSFNPTKYAMFKDVVARGDELKSAPIYDAASKTLTEIGRMANDAWHLAYATDPVEFAVLQDSYSFNNYYKPVERLLKSSYGIDISARADCVKGLAWGMCNLFGSGGVQKFFAAASLDGGMTDRELVESLCNSVIDYFSTGAGKNHAYAAGYVNRYKQEKRICLEYVAQHEAEQQRPGDVVTPEDEDQTEAPTRTAVRVPDKREASRTPSKRAATRSPRGIPTAAHPMMPATTAVRMARMTKSRPMVPSLMRVTRAMMGRARADPTSRGIPLREMARMALSMRMMHRWTPRASRTTTRRTALRATSSRRSRRPTIPAPSKRGMARSPRRCESTRSRLTTAIR